MAQNIVIGGATYPDVPGLSVPRSGGGNAYFMDPTEVFYDNAGAHNSIYRGKNLGTSVTAAQFAAIDAGTFEDIYPGDYWIINNYVFLAGGCNYWLHTGDTDCAANHLVIVPAGNLISGDGTKSLLNSSESATGAYTGTNFYKGTGGNTAKADCLSIIESAFGAAHILTHREYLKNAITNNYESGGAWYDSTLELMSEQMVFGHRIFGSVANGTSAPALNAIDHTQLPLFAYDRSLINVGENWWLRDVATSARFAYVGLNGSCGTTPANGKTIGIRPVFAICAEQEAAS